MGRIYIMTADDGLYKIGVSSNVEKRRDTLQRANGKQLNIIYKSEKMNNCYKLESKIHKKYDKYRTIGEWFDFTNENIEGIIKFINEKIDSEGDFSDKSKNEKVITMEELGEKFRNTVGKIILQNKIKKIAYDEWLEKERGYIKSIILNIKEIKEFAYDNEYVENNSLTILEIATEGYKVLKIISPETHEIYGEILKSEIDELLLTAWGELEAC